METKEEKKNITDNLANQRTFLAWVRTSISLMGFGFVIVKFAVFIKQVSIMLADRAPVVPKVYSGEIGLGMVIFGAIVALTGYVNFKKMQKEIQGDKYHRNNHQNLFITLFVLLVSLLLMIFLLPNIGL